MRARSSSIFLTLDFNIEDRSWNILAEEASLMYSDLQGSRMSPRTALAMGFPHREGTVKDDLSYSSASHSSMKSNPRPIRAAPAPANSSRLAGMDTQSSFTYPRRTGQDVDSFLTRESHLSDRESCISDAALSSYSYSGASVDLTLASTTTSPLVHPFLTSPTLRPSMLSPFQSASGGYTAQQIDKWCMDNDPSSNLYQQSTIYPVVDSLAMPSTGYPSGHYSTFEEGFSDEPQWPPVVPSRLPSRSAIHSNTTHHITAAPTAAPTSAITTSTTGQSVDQDFLSPSLESHSVLSSSPAPTVLSEFEPFSSSGQPSSPSSNPSDLSHYGIPAGEGVWRCAHPGCTSQALFRRGCDLRKHFNRHRKHLFCRYDGCPQSTQGGFSSKKDRTRHEAKHNPGVICEWDGCERVFSRVDNMKDHVRRIHRRKASR
ncbi:hypothetical protein PDE_03020 [Penicillium oxalicum 114-2]|uniref:C2H2-type domain-containing protein n=1 Tax=Penicillium oxalicum (strain 114-2 / CGMCC 5302) TaxID=933388 RepID=S7ZCS2_PENO1|nr:hypothetical protein PDE_03020 [Penicillium oxalicum 114-2]